MFGNMAGGMPLGSQMTNPIPPPPVTPAPVPSGGNSLSSFLGALFNPEQAAIQMAQQGITPEQFAKDLGSDHLAQVMKPTTGGGTVSNLFGGKPLIDRGGYELPKLGSSQRAPDAGAGSGNALADLMSPSQVPKPQQGPQRTNDLMTPGGKIIQPGPDHPDISAATPNDFITIQDVMALLTGDTPGAIAAKGVGGGLTGMPPMYGQGGDRGLSGVPPMFGRGGDMPIVPPIVPPTSPVLPPVFPAGQASPGANLPDQPINPPVVPPASVSPVNVADYTSGKLKTSVMGGAGGNAPDTQLSGNSHFNEFMSTLKAGGLTNPYGLAAAAATGKSESGFSEKNIYGSWADPSEKGVQGTSGGVMSWRDARFDAMRAFVKANGGDPNRPSTALQAKFFLQEDTNLINALNAAKSPEEAQTLMNNAWKFAGYDKPGSGEAARRIALARNFASSGNFGDLSGIIPAAEGGTVAGGGGAAMPGVGTGGQSLYDRMAALGAGLDSGSGSGQMDMNLPSAPSPIGPRPGQYSPDANMLKIMMALLAPGGAGGAGIPTLAQMMAGRAT